MPVYGDQRGQCLDCPFVCSEPGPIFKPYCSAPVCWLKPLNIKFVEKEKNELCLEQKKL